MRACVAAALAALAARCAFCEDCGYEDCDYEVNFGTYGYYYTYYEDLHDNWTDSGCRYASWDGIAWDFYGRFNWTDHQIWETIGNNTFLSTAELEAFVLGDDGSTRGGRAPNYDNTMLPTQWLRRR
jgi:hypothetical protein